MGLLDELKNKVAAREADATVPSATTLRVTEFRAQALPAMFLIHQNLSELVTHLQQLEEEAPASLVVPGIGEIAGLLQGSYILSADGMPPETITLRCSLRQQRERPLEITQPNLATEGWLDRLRQQGLQARLQSGRDAGRKSFIGLQAPIPASLQFSLDTDNSALALVTHNVGELGDRRQIFNPGNVTPQWCEELLKFVVRRENSFLRYEVPADMREELRKRIDWERRKGRGVPQPEDKPAGGIGSLLRVAIGKAAPAPAAAPEAPAATPAPEPAPAPVVEESADSRVANSPTIKQLLKRKPTLSLAYHGRTIDLTGREEPFILGRGDECHLQVNEEHVSKQHLQITYADGRYLLTDDSRNGTQIRYADGRVVRVHHTTVELEGYGSFSLGTRISLRNGHVIRFAVNP